MAVCAGDHGSSSLSEDPRANNELNGRSHCLYSDIVWLPWDLQISQSQPEFGVTTVRYICNSITWWRTKAVADYLQMHPLVLLLVTYCCFRYMNISLCCANRPRIDSNDEIRRNETHGRKLSPSLVRLTGKTNFSSLDERKPPGMLGSHL
ncbi:unnamed protein product [Calicophoron daubneyi]|uniref:Uncharacterized protein n=1 Tax=Calicophoron daubneyi TaxID=300641 RepID=A0AAV2TLT4_CALDB